MMHTAEIKKKLSTALSQRRYTHSLNTAAEAERLARHYGEDAEKAYLAGLVHDCAKEIDGTEAIRLLKEEYGVMPDAVAESMPSLLHGVLGACIAKSKFDVEDADILSAIKYHTTGAAGMSLLQKIIYIADYTEPGRSYDDVDILRRIAYDDLDAAILYAVDYTIKKLVKNGQPIHPNTVSCRNDILLRRQTDERSRYED